jgi:hypothetical protein
MKKGLCLLFLFLLVTSVFFVSAAANDTESKATACLESKVNGKCSSLSTEEKIFSLLSIGSCKSELLSDSYSNQCWPSQSCSVKTTAQAVLALAKSGISVKSAEDWLSSQSTAFKDINWYLQVEATNKSSCRISYSGSTYTFTVNEDRTISGRLGNCLSVYQDYWIKVSSSCYDQELTVSCSTSFLTSLLYQKKNPKNLYDFYIADKTNSASGEGTTAEKVNSRCFSSKGSCNYEGTLWATMVLKYLGEDVSSYIPYLITLSEDNSRYLPESFLYILTNNFRTELLVKQQENQWWSVSGDKFYDTALALLPFQNEDVSEKESAKGWLGSVQGADGCWQSNIRNTAFILYSLWAKNINVTALPMQEDCTSSDYFCMSDASCSALNGTTLTAYGGCLGTNICCDKEKKLETCSDEGGTLCDSGEQCLGGNDISSSDSSSSKLCCVDGTCGVQETTPCETNSGSCRSSCLDNEEVSSDSCSATTICCMEKEQTASYLWLIIVGILLVLVLIGFVFRKKLRELFMRFRFGKGSGKPAVGGPRFPPTSSSRLYPGAVQRRILTPQSSQRPLATATTTTTTTKKTTVKPVARKPASKADTTDLLKRLRDIGK